MTRPRTRHTLQFQINNQIGKNFNVVKSARRISDSRLKLIYSESCMNVSDVPIYYIIVFRRDG